MLHSFGVNKVTHFWVQFTWFRSSLREADTFQQSVFWPVKSSV